MRTEGELSEDEPDGGAGSKIPFTCIQFPLYEKMKSTLAAKTLGLHSVDDLPARYAAVCGSVAGGIAAALTTPLDVAKTRIMLSSGEYSSNFVKTMARIAKEEGPKTLFRGVVPRVTWISIGGAIFLGVYERAKKVLVERDMLA